MRYKWRLIRHLVLFAMIVSLPAAIAAQEKLGQTDKDKVLEGLSQTAADLAHTVTARTPTGVRYKRLPPEITQKAAELIKAIVEMRDAKKAAELLHGYYGIGPHLWRKLKVDPSAEKLAKTKLGSDIPIMRKGQLVGFQQAVSRGVRDATASAVFWEMFFRHVEFGKYLVLRPLDAEELKNYWTVTPFDITDPIFIAEDGKTKLLFDLAVVDQSIPKFAWSHIEDLSNPNYPFGVGKFVEPTEDLIKKFQKGGSAVVVTQPGKATRKKPPPLVEAEKKEWDGKSRF